MFSRVPNGIGAPTPPTIPYSTSVHTSVMLFRIDPKTREDVSYPFLRRNYNILLRCSMD